VKIDPSGISSTAYRLNNLALSRFSVEERQRIGVAYLPGSDLDSTHSGDVDYAELLPSLFQLKVGNFYIALAGERDRVRVLKIIREHLKATSGCSSASSRRSTPASRLRGNPGPGPRCAQYIPVGPTGYDRRLGILALRDDTSTSATPAFAKIRSRVRGTALASEILEAADGGKRERGGTAALRRSVRTPKAF